MSLIRRFLRDVLRRVDMTIARLNSFFDDPHASNKASMTRLCALLSMLGALWTTKQLVAFAFLNKDNAGMAGILAGATTTLGATIVLGLLLRKKSDGSTESNDDDPPPAQSNDLKLTASLSSTSADVKP
jgi:hypothetical protein